MSTVLTAAAAAVTLFLGAAPATAGSVHTEAAVETFRVGRGGSLASLGSVATGLGAAAGHPLEGIAAS